MYCQNCAAFVDDNATRCPNCGAAVGQSRSVGAVSPVDAVKALFIRYADFQGRSRRSEYWWVFLFNLITSRVFAAVSTSFATVWGFALLIPILAVGVRRLHDTGRSGWWVLLNLIPLVGTIILIVWLCQDSSPDNQYGPNPKK